MLNFFEFRFSNLVIVSMILLQPGLCQSSNTKSVVKFSYRGSASRSVASIVGSRSSLRNKGFFLGPSGFPTAGFSPNCLHVEEQ